MSCNCARSHSRIRVVMKQDGESQEDWRGCDLLRMFLVKGILRDRLESEDAGCYLCQGAET